MRIKQILKNAYELVATIKEGGAIVRVWKARSIGELPDGLKKDYAHRLIDDAKTGGHGRGYWRANPDYGSWDALVLKKYSNEKPYALHPKNELDVYVCSILVRPYTRLSLAAYQSMSSKDLGKPPFARAMMMWDSRVFDKACETVAKFYKENPKLVSEPGMRIEEYNGRLAECGVRGIWRDLEVVK